jgi:Flp pilus assembly protein TadG
MRPCQVRICRFKQRSQRAGAVLVETALVVSVFAIVMAGVIEFGHVYLVVGTISAAARGGARTGAVEGVSTAEVRAETERLLGASFNKNFATIQVKDASVFDQPSLDPATINYSSLPDVEVKNLDTGQLFLVRVEVPYEAVALMPPFWAKGITLRSQAVMRHE